LLVKQRIQRSICCNPAGTKKLTHCSPEDQQRASARQKPLLFILIVVVMLLLRKKLQAIDGGCMPAFSGNKQWLPSLSLPVRQVVFIS
jgi:hypothetical protein